MNTYLKAGALLLFFLSIYSTGLAQTFKGRVLDKETHQPIPFAEVFFVELNAGRVTDEYGIFKIDHFHPKNMEVQISFVGYNTLKTTIDMTRVQEETFYLEPNHIELSEVVVSVPIGKLQNENVISVEQKKITALQQNAPVSLAEAITNIAGVEQNSTGVGIGKPVIRGLTGNRIVTYAQGIRIENQQWGGEHGLGIGATGIESVEVIKGPASVLYGSDALGGVLYFVDERYAPHNTLQAHINSAILSNTLGTNTTFGVKLHNENFLFNLFGGYANHADYQLATNQRVFNSRFDENNIKAALGFHKKNWISNVRYSYLLNHFGITDSANYVTTVDRSFILPYQKIGNHNFSIENTFFTKKSSWSLLLGYSENNRKEFEDDENSPVLAMKLKTATYNLKWNSPSFFHQTLDIIVGSQGMYQTNANHGVEILIPNAKTADIGIFTLANYSLYGIQLQGGLRYDHRAIDTEKVDDPVLGVPAFNNNYNSFNYSGGVAYSLNPFTFRANLASGFRAPNTSELLSNGVHEGTNRFEKGNPNLKNEQATQIDVSVDFKNKHLEITINPFFNTINNYIYLSPTNTVIQGVSVYEYLQTSAQLTGGEAGLHYHPHFIHWLHIKTTFASVFAKDASGTPLPLIPPPNWTTNIKATFNSSKKIRVTSVYLQNIYKFNQNRVGAFETPTQQYNLLNLGVSLAIGKGSNPIEIIGGIKNILNASYTDHLSRLKVLGIPNPGINFFFRIKLGFETKI